MRRRVAVSLLLAAGLAAPPSLAATASRTEERAPAVVRLLDCDVAARTADFSGDMKAVPGTHRMQMRFTLQARRYGGDFERLSAPRLGVWVTSSPGRQRYVFDKHLEGLQPGVYRMRVRFRWRDAAGAVLRAASRRSKACRVPDPRPDLVPRGVGVLASTATTWRYVVVVANRGRSEAPPSRVSLQVGKVVLPDARAPRLAPGEEADVAFEGPPCAPGEDVVAIADATGLIDEAREADDVLTVPCPTG